MCHTDCVSGKCTEGGNALTCTECAESTKYLNSGSCVVATSCPSGKFLFLLKFLWKLQLMLTRSLTWIKGFQKGTNIITLVHSLNK